VKVGRLRDPCTKVVQQQLVEGCSSFASRDAAKNKSFVCSFQAMGHSHEGRQALTMVPRHARSQCRRGLRLQTAMVRHLERNLRHLRRPANANGYEYGHPTIETRKRPPTRRRMYGSGRSMRSFTCSAGEAFIFAMTALKAKPVTSSEPTATMMSLSCR
jgi:hypothetical protein